MGLHCDESSIGIMVFDRLRDPAVIFDLAQSSCRTRHCLSVEQGPQGVVVRSHERCAETCEEGIAACRSQLAVEFEA